MDPRIANRSRPASRVPGDIARWRRARLVQAGFANELAGEVAADAGYDLHELLELIDRGCPTALAARIAAPL